jgi:hypothetical protein
VLIYFDSSLFKKLSSDAISGAEYASLECIAIALRKGTHLITGDRRALIAASKVDGLSFQAKQAFSKAATRAAQSRALVLTATAYALVGDFPQAVNYNSEDNVLTIKISLAAIVDLEIQSPCEIIFEDLSDKYIYEIISDWYKKYTLNAPHLPLNFRPIHGGGSRTHVVYQERQDKEQTFCLCITDTDKKYPTDTPGPTCTGVVSADDPHKPLSKHLNLDFQEIENLLPLDHLSKYAKTNEARSILESLKQAETNGYPESKLYFDYKKGLNVQGLCRNESKAAYWTNALLVPPPVCRPNCTNNPCLCFVVKPWPFRSEVKSHIEQKVAISPEDCPVLKDLWNNIGANITSWSIASSPQLA